MVYIYKLNDIFLTHFLNFGRYSFWQCTQYQVPFHCTCWNCCYVFVFELQQGCVATSGQPYSPCSKVYPNRPPWPPKHILHQASSNTPRHTTRPSNMAIPSFAGHVTAWESVVVTLQPKNHSWHVTARESVIAPRSFSTNSDRRDILPPDHPRRQSHLLPVTSWRENLSSSRPKNLSSTCYSPNSVILPLEPENLFVT